MYYIISQMEKGKRSVTVRVNSIMQSFEEEMKFADFFVMNFPNE